MENLKHAIAAVLAVVMVGSLAVTQATDFQSVQATKLAGKNTQTAAAPAEAIEFEWNLDIQTKDADFEFVLDRDDLVFEPFMAYVIHKDGAALRKEPQGEIVATLSCGEQVCVVDEFANWFVVTHAGSEAYLSKELLSTEYDDAKRVLLEHYMFETGRVDTDGSTLNIRSGPAQENTQIIGQAEDGDLIVALEHDQNGWMKVYYGENYQTGYVSKEFVVLDDLAPRQDIYAARSARLDAITKAAEVVSDGKTANILYMPDPDAPIIGTLADGTTCNVIEKGSQWTKIVFGEQKSIGYVRSAVILTKAEKAAQEEARRQEEARKKQEAEKAATKQATAKATVTAQKSQPVQSTGGSATGQAIVNEAKKYLGVRYVYGGTSPSGFDCSGLVQYVCRKVGISVNRSSRSQYSNGVSVAKSELQPGDLVFFSKGGGISHVGIYAGGGQVIHSPRPGKSVCYVSLDSMCGYSTYVGARRVV